MPSEIRHILFRPAEAARATLDHLRRARRNQPMGDVIDCFVEPSLPWAGEAAAPRRGVALAVVMDPSRDLPRGEVSELMRLSLAGEELMQALIAYCQNNGVPLPIDGDKSLQRFGDQIGIVITLDDSAVVAPVVAARMAMTHAA
ncbi:hypothetical protein ACQW02_18640 [Humitalea sp. 24SJ18S-53]|uniref:hypothetical protein n=1 Tax=Humitalea sp. 24SJ18S-53 TaxID=3422307 RepID=UPI003D667E35